MSTDLILQTRSIREDLALIKAAEVSLVAFLAT